MKVKRIDGILFEKMLVNGLNNLKQNETKINEMNVFPVPDGDTGSNMRMTLENGLRSAKTNANLGAYAVALSQGMLMGARGNSGVILSQIFKGFSENLRRCSIIDAKEFLEGFIAGYKCAYNAVIKPVEGTILTVAREGIEHIRDQINRGMYIDNFFSIYVLEMKKSLDYTPNILPCLKEAGVLDSGGAGYILIIEGMYKFLQDEIINGEVLQDDSNAPKLDTAKFDEYSSFDYGYCLEFILQLMVSKTDISKFNQKLFIKDLEGLGESLVVVKDGTKVKVHIHTKLPAHVITYAQTYGEFVTFKLENMALQHSNLEAHEEEKKLPHVDLAKIGIVNGEQLKEIYTELGCHIVLDGGKTMNTSSEEIVKAIKMCDAEKIVIFTNNKNIELACNQAIDVLKQDNIHMIKSKNSLQGYYALAMDEADNDNLDYRIKQMEAGVEAISTITLFNASRDCTLNGVDIKKDNIVASNDSIILASHNDIYNVVKKSLEQIKDISDKAMCIILKGKNFNYDLESLEKAINEANPYLEINYMDGGLEIYDAIIGLV